MAISFLRKASKTILVSCNVAIALLLLAGCYGSWLNPDYFWFTSLFTIATFYFFLILLGFLIFWLFVKYRLSLISIIAIVLCWGPLRHVFRLRINEDFVVARKDSALRVMSWNVEHFDILEHKTHPEKKQQMVASINSMQPDVACFQEMVASDFSSKAINYLPDFIEWLNMPYYHYSYNPKLDFDASHRFGIIILSKYPIIHKETISFPPGDYNSIFQYADIVKHGDTFRVFNIHLQSLKFTAVNRQYIEDPSLKDEADLQKSKNVLDKFKTGFFKRKKQSDHIRAEIEKSPYPVIVCGDFNDVPNSYAYRTIGKGLTNAFTEKGAGIGNTFDGISPTLRIDNIFADNHFSITQFTRTRKKLSDHFPITADLLPVSNP